MFDSAKPTKTVDEHSCYGFPCDSKPHNQMWDVQKRLPIYSKAPKSKSYHCAGYYVIKFNNAWIKEYCPKAITTARYKFFGPFKTEDEQLAKLTQILQEDA